MVRELIVAFFIVAICVVLHTTGMVMCVEWLLRRRELIAQKSGLVHQAGLLIFVSAFVVFLHLTGTAIWALFYWQNGLFPTIETALYFSLGSYTTIGYGDVVLPQKWRLVGGIEGLSGVLLCGLSTAFIFAIVNALFKIRIRRQTNNGL